MKCLILVFSCFFFLPQRFSKIRTSLFAIKKLIGRSKDANEGAVTYEKVAQEVNGESPLQAEDEHNNQVSGKDTAPRERHYSFEFPDLVCLKDVQIFYALRLKRTKSQVNTKESKVMHLLESARGQGFGKNSKLVIASATFFAHFFGIISFLFYSFFVSTSKYFIC